MLGFAQQGGFHVRGLIRSPLLGPKGNAEFLAWLGQAEAEGGSEEIGPLVERALT